MKNTRFQMKSRRQNKTGLTLTELLVATILMGIVMLGIVSVDFGIKQMTKKISQTALLKMYTSSVLQRIAQDAASMTGDWPGGPCDLGFQTQGPSRFFFRQDIDSSGALNNTPGDCSDDSWICYDLSGTNIRRCNKNNPNGACPGGGPNAGVIIGTAVNNPDPPGLTMTFQKDNTTTQKYYLEISLTNRKDPAIAANCPDPSSAATCPNPEVTISSRVYPFSQHSRLPSDSP